MSLTMLVSMSADVEFQRVQIWRNADSFQIFLWQVVTRFTFPELPVLRFFKAKRESDGPAGPTS